MSRKNESKKNILENLNIRLSLIIPVVLALLIVCLSSFTYIITEQYSTRLKELMTGIEQSTKLIIMTNVSNLRNYLATKENLPLEQNISTFIMDDKIISITITDSDNNQITKFDKEKKGKLITKKANFLWENQKIGSLEIIYSDYYLQQVIKKAAIQLIIICCLIIGVMILIVSIITNLITGPISKLTKIAGRIAGGETGLTAQVSGQGEVRQLAWAFNTMTSQLNKRADEVKETNDFLSKIISDADNIIFNLNTNTKEIEVSIERQTDSVHKQASGIMEVSATLEELAANSRQITRNTSSLVLSSQEIVKTLDQNQSDLINTVASLDEVEAMSVSNTKSIMELGKKSAMINEMVEIIKAVANKTNILSINASIEASRSQEAGTGFAVVAKEIRELSKETITSARNVENVAGEIQKFLKTIVTTSDNESKKVIGSVKIVKKMIETLEQIIIKINSNFSFTQEIDTTIKQHETGSLQASDTMKHISELARQTVESSKQILKAMQEIVALNCKLTESVKK